MNEKSGLYQNETGSDGISDTAWGQNHYPLIGMFSNFNASLGKHVNVISNSTIEGFEYFQSNSMIKMFVSNMTTGKHVDSAESALLTL